MQLPKLLENVKTTLKGTYLLYPIIVILAIPLLLIVNTVWNLKNFNRDVNFLLRHQAVSISDTIKPQVMKSLHDISGLNLILGETKDSNSEIVSMSVVKESGNKFTILSTTDTDFSQSELEKLGLNQLAIGYNQPVAGLSYDPKVGKNVWNVSVPLSQNNQDSYLLFLKYRIDKVEEILGRTARDSYLILAGLIVATIILLINHFIFFGKAQRTRELEELDKLKDEFISMAAHELKAPISGVIGYLELLKEQLSPEDLKKLGEEFSVLGILIDNLNKLINDLLDVSRIEQGRFKIEIKEVNATSVVEEVIKSQQPNIDKKGLTLKLNIAKNIPTIKSDPDRIRQIVTNLLSNAIKYTLKGNVEVSVLTKDNTLTVEVRDSGIGIPAEELPNLFSKFHRVKDRQTSEVRGTGLGLWITKQIVEKLGGKIGVESIYGTGSKFLFTLPLNSQSGN